MVQRSGSLEAHCGSLRTTDLLFSDRVLIFKEKKRGKKKAFPGQTLEGSSALSSSLSPHLARLSVVVPSVPFLGTFLEPCASVSFS